MMTQMLLLAALAAINVQNMCVGQELPLPPAAEPGHCSVEVNNRLDCYPDSNASEQSCRTRGCCWSPTDVGRPWCFYPPGFNAYEMVDKTHFRRKYRSQFPADIPLLKVVISSYSENVAGFKITDDQNERFVPPYPQLTLPSVKNNAPNLLTINRDDESALLNVRRADRQQPMFQLKNENFIYADQFIQFTLNATGRPTLYGLGEHRTNLALDENWTKVTMWNHDVGPRENTNLYGSHPFFLAVGDNGESFGMYLHNSNAMEVVIQPGPLVTFRTIGGIIEGYVFAGPKPADVIRQYVQLVGLPALPPYWGLGFQLCRWGYGSSNNTRAVWQRNRDAGIPFDVQWNDIDYMRSNNDFTIDPVNYAGLAELVDDIHAAGMRYVSMVDPGVSGSEPAGTYPPYEDGVSMDTLVKDHDGNIFIGHVWNAADTVYPDFFHPRALEYWTKQLREFHGKIPFDALWIDMNEPSNVYDGLRNGCPNNNLENPPYVPAVDGNKLQTKTLCLTARHATGLHYNLHNLYSISEANITLRAAENILGKRTFLISRSSFSGIGRYAGHWSGDNFSSWSEMAASIVEMLTFSLYGVPFMGADICGFAGNTNRELCNRWMQLGSFYSFSRNHNTMGSVDQDPAAFDEEFILSAIYSLSARYKLLPYLYTLLYYAHTRGDTVVRPLVLEFPEDTKVRNIDRSFLWGSSIYFIPVLEEGATTVDAYLPNGRWYNLGGFDIKGAGGIITLDAPFSEIPILIRGGAIIPLQDNGQTTVESRKQKFVFLVVPDSNENATGSLFWDDGESLGTIESGNYGLLDLKLSGKIFSSTVVHWGTDNKPVLGSIVIFGQESMPSRVIVNGKDVQFSYSERQKLIVVYILNSCISENITLTWM